MEKSKQRNLIYWKARKVDLREAIVELMKAYCFAEVKVRQCERLALKTKGRP